MFLVVKIRNLLRFKLLTEKNRVAPNEKMNNKIFKTLSRMNKPDNGSCFGCFFSSKTKIPVTTSTHSSRSSISSHY